MYTSYWSKFKDLWHKFQVSLLFPKYSIFVLDVDYEPVQIYYSDVIPLPNDMILLKNKDIWRCVQRLCMSEYPTSIHLQCVKIDTDAVESKMKYILNDN